MAEPDGNPPASPPIPPDGRPVPASPGAHGEPPEDLPELLMPAPRVNPPSVFNPKDAPPAPPSQGQPGFTDFLAWVQTFGGGQTAPPPPSVPSMPTAEPPGRGTLSRKEKKFHRYEPDAARPGNAPGSAVPDATEGGEAGRTIPDRRDFRAPGSNPPVKRKRRQKSSGPSDGEAFRWFLPRFFIVALLGGAFWIGRKTAPRPITVSVAPAVRTILDRAEPWTRVPGLIDEAMNAEARQNFTKATGLLEQVQGEHSRVLGVDYHLAELAFEDGDMPRALALANRSIEKGDEIAACYNLRGAMTNRIKGINAGLDDLETATQVDPYNPRYFYFLGEALRRAGQPQAAVLRLRQASDRQRDPLQKGVYALKTRLALIESGRESEFADQLAEELRRTPPAIDWIFTAAAVELHHGRFDAAGGFLDSARALVDQETMDIRLRDFFFFGFANEKALAKFYAPLRQPAASAQATASPAATPLSAVDLPVPKDASVSPGPSPATLP